MASKVANEPVRLLEDADTGHRFLIYGTESGVRVELRYDGDELWMTQAQIAGLFGRDRSVISKHIKSILDEGEIREDGNVQKMHIASSDKPTSIYSLNVVISVGYRVSSRQATQFRIWATDTLVQFATKGFVVDVQRLKSAGAADRVAELREILRDIRSDKANVYREVRAICVTCRDYDPKSKAWRDYYARMQAKIVFEVTSKNYLDDQLKIGRIAEMSDAEKHLDTLIKTSGRALLQEGGTVKSSIAEAHAKTQFKLYSDHVKRSRHVEADNHISELVGQARRLPKTRQRKKPV